MKFDLDFWSLLLKFNFELQPSVGNFVMNESGNVEKPGIDGWHLLECVSYCWGSLLFIFVFLLCFPAGNAALVLRSRLKVKVVKEHREKSPVQNGIEENGVVSANLEKEVGKQIMQYQVRGHTKPGEPINCWEFVPVPFKLCSRALGAEELLHTFPLCTQSC